MADQPGTLGSVAGDRAVPELEARTATWRIGLATLGLLAVIGGLAAAVVSASGEPRPPDLGGPILARGAVTTSAPTPSADSSPPPELPVVTYQRSGDGGEVRVSAAPVPVRPVPLPVASEAASARTPRTTAPEPAARTAQPAPSLPAQESTP
ncbi:MULTISPECIES: hypothetical protein [Pseudofrankia]|uniref:hypothetical protein n=1 Tax=Pseudofrankia TaxID=2994363 RepID=UPI00104218D2|nr:MULTISPECIES: hypothetical protein [Pseudofrankia]